MLPFELVTPTKDSVPSISRIIVMNQKSVWSIVMANPPSKTTVAQINPSVPSPVAAFSRTARRRAKRVSLFSGARLACRGPDTDGVLLAAVSMLDCGSKMAGVWLIR
ncbi:hypothetical protein Hdeb2414_s0004g00136381 [Helianthus debilis subsp. tardiflorus]